MTDFTDLGKAYAAKVPLEKLLDAVVLVDAEDGEWVLKVFADTDMKEYRGIKVVPIQVARPHTRAGVDIYPEGVDPKDIELPETIIDEVPYGEI